MVNKNNYIDEPTINKNIIKEIILIDPSCSTSKGYAVVLARKNDIGIYRIYKDGCDIITDMGSTKPGKVGNIRHLAITPVGSGSDKSQIIALITEEDEILITDSQLTLGKAVKFCIGEKLLGKLDWCGANSVAIITEEKIILIGSNKAKAEFNIEFKNGFHVYNEVDGLKVFTEDSCYFIEKVPIPIEKISTMLSMEPSAQMISAFQKYLTNDPRTEDILKGIKEDSKANIIRGIKDLLKAATYEFKPIHQKYLLKAASFANNFLVNGEYDAEEIVSVLQRIRLINQLHVPKVIYC